MLQIGVDSFVATQRDPATGGDVERVQQLLAEVELAERVGLDVFAIGEHHRPDYVSSAPAVLLAAAAARTEKIRLASAVTVLSSDDPVRVYQQFATLDLISKGRAEIIVGRGSFIESYPLFGYDLDDYDQLFSEKLELLLKIRQSVKVTWSGKTRAALTGQGVYPRAAQAPLPVWLGVGGTPASFVRAGTLGLPLILAIIGGEPHRFRPYVDLYRDAWKKAGHDPAKLQVGVHFVGFLAERREGAVETFWPAYRETFGRIGRERGWPAPTRGQFDALTAESGALMVGDPETVARKLAQAMQALGGVNRISLLIDNRGLTAEQTLKAIELLGTNVAPQVREAAARQVAAAAQTS